MFVPSLKVSKCSPTSHIVNVDSRFLMLILPFLMLLGAINEAAHTLTDAYEKNPLLSWIIQPIKDDRKKHDIQHLLFKAAVNSASLQSRDFAIQVDGCKGVCVWSTNEQQLSFAKILGWKITKIANLAVAMVCPTLMIRFIFECTYAHKKNQRINMGLQHFLDKSKKKIMKAEPHIYINYMGVLPQERNKGLGTAMLQHVISKAEATQLPIYLVVSDASVVPFLERNGFQVKEVAVFNSIPSTFMMRPASLSTDSPLKLKLKPGRRDSDDSL